MGLEICLKLLLCGIAFWYSKLEICLDGCSMCRGSTSFITTFEISTIFSELFSGFCNSSFLVSLKWEEVKCKTDESWSNIICSKSGIIDFFGSSWISSVLDSSTELFLFKCELT